MLYVHACSGEGSALLCIHLILWPLLHRVITPRKCARGNSIEVIMSSLLSLAQKSSYLENVGVYKRLISIMNQSNSAKSWLQCASNRGIRSMSIIKLCLFVGHRSHAYRQCMMHAHCIFYSCAKLLWLVKSINVLYIMSVTSIADPLTEIWSPMEPIIM